MVPLGLEPGDCLFSVPVLVPTLSPRLIHVPSLIIEKKSIALILEDLKTKKQMLISAINI